MKKIHWQENDRQELKKAINNFNKKINKLEKLKNDVILPEKKSIDKTQKEIKTRDEFKRVLQSLKEFQKEGAEEIYTTQAGEKITVWERNLLENQRNIMNERINAELKTLNEPLKNSKYSRVQMGSERARELEAQLKNLEKLEQKSKYEFKLLKTRIEKQGTLDYNMKKAIVYRENYIKEMEKYSHLDNYDKFMKKLKSIRNPVEFYESIKDHELASDLTYQSDEFFTQAEFNNHLQEWGIEIDESTEIEIIKKEKVSYRYSLVDKSGNVISQSDSLQTLRNQALNYKGTTWIRDNKYFR